MRNLAAFFPGNPKALDGPFSAVFAPTPAIRRTMIIQGSFEELAEIYNMDTILQISGPRKNAKHALRGGEIYFHSAKNAMHFHFWKTYGRKCVLILYLGDVLWSRCCRHLYRQLLEADVWPSAIEQISESLSTTLASTGL